MFLVSSIEHLFCFTKSVVCHCSQHFRTLFVPFFGTLPLVSNVSELEAPKPFAVDCDAQLGKYSVRGAVRGAQLACCWPSRPTDENGKRKATSD